MCPYPHSASLWSGRVGRSCEGHRIFSTDQAHEFSSRVGLKDSYLVEALYHLRRNHWIVSLRRGLYAISSSVPGVAPTHEFEIAMALVEPAAISHWSALHYHGLTEQAPRRVFVLTTTRGQRSHGGEATVLMRPTRYIASVRRSTGLSRSGPSATSAQKKCG